MTDQTQTSTQTTTPPPPQPNSPDARTPTGELKDLQAQSTTTADGTISSDSTTSETGEQPKPSSAPETYADFTAPEGQKLSPKLIAEATPIFKELNLDQASAQRLIDFVTKNQLAEFKTADKLISDMKADWSTKLHADPDIGGKLESVKVDLGRMLTHLGPSETPFRQAMSLTGAGDHPDVIKGLYQLSKMINEGRPVTGTGPSPLGQTPNGAAKPRSAAASLYPNLPSSSQS